MCIEPFPCFVPNTHKLYMLGLWINIVFISQRPVTIIVCHPAKKNINPCAVIFELNDKLTQLSFGCSYFRSTESELIYSYFPKAHRVQHLKEYQKSYQI
jgi:hypothetical protein